MNDKIIFHQTYGLNLFNPVDTSKRQTLWLTLRGDYFPSSLKSSLITESLKTKYLKLIII